MRVSVNAILKSGPTQKIANFCVVTCLKQEQPHRRVNISIPMPQDLEG